MSRRIGAADVADIARGAAILGTGGGGDPYIGRLLAERAIRGGFARGTARLTGTGGFDGRTLELEFQNENLVARRDGRVVAGVPDLICVLETDGGDPVTTEGLRYGFRVSVVGAPRDPRWRTPAGLDLVGPGYFGYDHDYVPVEELACAS